MDRKAALTEASNLLELILKTQPGLLKAPNLTSKNGEELADFVKGFTEQYASYLENQKA